MTSQLQARDPKQITLIAGNGSLPSEFIKSASDQDYIVSLIRIKNEAGPELDSLVSVSEEVKVTNFGKILKILKNNNSSLVAFAGGIKKTKIFDAITFDPVAIKLLAKTKSFNDDVLLRAIAEEIEKLGIEVVAPTAFLSQSVPKEPGVITKRSPSAKEIADIVLAYPITQEIGRLEIGQMVVIKDGVVVAVEAVDGTDATIKRGGDVAKTSGKFKAGAGAVLVKLAKPQQDLRFDLPTIGKRTLVNCYEAGISSIAVEVNKSIILNQSELLPEANKLGISIIAVNQEYVDKNKIA